MYFKLFRLAVNALHFFTRSSDAHFNQADLVEPSLVFFGSPTSLILSHSFHQTPHHHPQDLALSYLPHIEHIVFSLTPLSSTLNLSFLSDFLHDKFFPESINPSFTKVFRTHSFYSLM